MDLKSLVSDVADFPAKGVVFKDITGILKNAEAFAYVVDAMSAPYKNKGITKVVGVESRGFFFASAAAYALGAGFVPIRKEGKLPRKTKSCRYESEYASCVMEMHEDALVPSDKVLMIDDVLATGGTAAAAVEMVRSFGVEPEAFVFLMELGFLNGRKKLRETHVESLIKY